MSSYRGLCETSFDAVDAVKLEIAEVLVRIAVVDRLKFIHAS